MKLIPLLSALVLVSIGNTANALPITKVKGPTSLYSMQSSSSSAAAAADDDDGGTGGSVGPTGPTGPTGAGIAPGANFLRTTNFISEGSRLLDPGSPIPFNQAQTADIVGGTAITHPASTDIVFTESGVYYVVFSGNTANTESDTPVGTGNDYATAVDDYYTAHMFFRLDGVQVGPEVEVEIRGGTMYIADFVVVPTPPATLDVFLEQDHYVLSDGDIILTALKVSDDIITPP